MRTFQLPIMVCASLGQTLSVQARGGCSSGHQRPCLPDAVLIRALVEKILDLYLGTCVAGVAGVADVVNAQPLSYPYLPCAVYFHFHHTGRHGQQ
jgi:hypothetical protein